ncbi:MAG: pyridoxamine 5'-phosphate oxidase [Pseudomonadota bacterium]
MDQKDIQSLRDDFSEVGIGREDMLDDPIEQLISWFQQAVDSGMPEPNAMCLSTVDSSYHPWQRTVLMKGLDANGIVFYTNYTSTKAQQMGEQSAVSVLYPWLALHRQVIVHGTVEKIARVDTEAYFLTRPRSSQIGAWASYQSQILSTREELEQRWTALSEQFSENDVPVPDFWGGYRIKPSRFEFWQGRNSRLHDRIVYLHDRGQWIKQRLSP